MMYSEFENLWTEEFGENSVPSYVEYTNIYEPIYMKGEYLCKRDYVKHVHKNRLKMMIDGYAKLFEEKEKIVAEYRELENRKEKEISELYDQRNNLMLNASAMLYDLQSVVDNMQMHHNDMKDRIAAC